MKKPILICLLFLLPVIYQAQDTFSILAFDSITREVGAAGASCVDLFGTPYHNDFVCEVFPDSGAIAVQGSYVSLNQVMARMRMRNGDSPTQVLAYLLANDVSSAPDAYASRQYGVVNLNTSDIRAAAYTGTACAGYKNHITGPNYSIQGNVLLGQQVLDSMEARFLRAKGDLACKLMEAMQGAKMLGADTRCAGNKTSSLFAFLKVAQPRDKFGDLSLKLSVRTSEGESIEPIDSLQVMFDEAHSCLVNTNEGLGIGSTKGLLKMYSSVHGRRFTFIWTGDPQDLMLAVYDSNGKVMYSAQFSENHTLLCPDWPLGNYLAEVKGNLGAFEIRDLILR